MRKIACAASVALLAAMSGFANAQTIDGNLDAAYGDAVAVQTVDTGFGDNFSEWNAAYGTISGGQLNLLFTGNLEANFNKLEIFIDSGNSGTSNVFSSAGNDGAGAMDGMIFDNGFTPDYHIIARRGNAGGDQFDLDFANLATGNFDSYVDVGAGFNDMISGSTGTGIANLNPIAFGFDNSNTGGIGAGTGAADQTAALSVTTGLELGINLADLGSPSGSIRVMLLQNNQGHNFLSNQTLGGLAAGTGNIGSPSGLDFNNFSGDQFFTVVPEPSTAGLIGMIFLTGMVRRRR